ncbi:DUF7513 family protein [Natronobacterium texcoconense]|uniref:DUF7513 domain-containing protein n=1 Tax=Natronobacterium texcoconense TaxID=1095778 RepID=A0A1H1HNV4_NATTX|nr:TRAM domain-containing protein [Natronobacterium texcoconense]SDR26736.1 hypothetical protein SAMN04489842_2892 [Natronobacterium texcoconense]
MSLLEKYFKGWQFRSTTPSLEPGTEVNVFVSRYDGDGIGVVNVGDTRLYVEGVDPAHVEKRVRVEVTSFDEEKSTGRGEFREVVGESSYTA